MAGKRGDLSGRFVEAVFGVADGVSVADQRHLAHEDAVHPHLPGQRLAVPEAAIGVSRKLVEGLADFAGGGAIALVMRALVETDDDVAGHGVVEAFEANALQVALFIDELVHDALDEIPVLGIAGRARHHLDAVQGVPGHVRPARQAIPRRAGVALHDAVGDGDGPGFRGGGGRRGRAPSAIQASARIAPVERSVAIMGRHLQKGPE